MPPARSPALRHRTARAIGCLALAALVGCSQQGSQLLVVVDSDYAVPSDFSELRVRITNPMRPGVTEQPFDLARPAMDAGTTRYTLPLSFGVTPFNADASQRVVIELAVIDARGTVQSTRTVSTGFIAGQARLLTVFLPRACHGSPCMPPNTCGDVATCVNPTIDPATLPQVTSPSQATTFDVPDVQPLGVDAPSDMVDAQADAVDVAPDVVDAQPDVVDVQADVAPEERDVQLDITDVQPDLVIDAYDAPPCDGAMTQTDPLNCGSCGHACTGSAACVNGSCVDAPFVSDGNEGAFAPTGPSVVLASGVHQFTTINIPAGTTVRVMGAGALELRATGDVTIDGTVDLSGGSGAQGGYPDPGANGGGGETATGVAGAMVTNVCSPGGGGGTTPGSAPGASAADGGACGAGGTNGGGAGGGNGSTAISGGGGGGGYAGGGGAGGAGYDGAPGGGVGGGAGGTNNGGGGGGDSALGAMYGGGVGGPPGPPWQALAGGGGGGGSIGAGAAADLAVATTFRPGSAAGGGGGSSGGGGSGGGGGGGGGALRVTSYTAIRLSAGASILANGGDGGSTAIYGGAGGGGSGGVIYLAAPVMVLAGTITAHGGSGNGSSAYGGFGGAGGLGRIRVSTDPAQCTWTGMANPAAVAGCMETPGGMSGNAYVGVYPN